LSLMLCNPTGLQGLTIGATMTQYLTKPQAAQFLGVSTRTLTRWLALPDPPPCVRLGGRLRYDRDALAAWATQQTQQVTA
jgi:predicted DNA-binding transcriptional regulator AlpA